MKIIDYTLLEADSPEDLSTMIRKFLNDGYQPYGNHLASGNTTEAFGSYTQAMVKYEEETDHVVSGPPGGILSQIDSEKMIQDEIDERVKFYQQYWNPGTNMYEIDKGTPNEWICTQQELQDDIELGVRSNAQL